MPSKNEVIFKANGKRWSTDQDYMSELQGYIDANDNKMASTVFDLGVFFGRIRLLSGALKLRK